MKEPIVAVAWIDCWHRWQTWIMYRRRPYPSLILPSDFIGPPWNIDRKKIPKLIRRIRADLLPVTKGKIEPYIYFLGKPPPCILRHRPKSHQRILAHCGEQ